MSACGSTEFHFAEGEPAKKKAKTTNNNNVKNGDDGKTAAQEQQQQRQPAKEEKGGGSNPGLILLSELPDAVLMNILKFIGPGQYIFIALICRRFKELYEEYFSKLLKEDKIPWVRSMGQLIFLVGGIRKAKVTNTFYSAAFSSVSCAKFWCRDTSRGYNDEGNRFLGNHVCQTIAKYGQLKVLQWARQQFFPWDGDTLAVAIKKGHQDIVEWARSNGCPEPEDSSSSSSSSDSDTSDSDSDSDSDSFPN